MGRRRASRRTAEQKLARIEHRVEREREDLRDTLATRREVLDLINRGVQAYDEQYVAEWRAVVEYMAMPWWRRLWWRFNAWRKRGDGNGTGDAGSRGEEPGAAEDAVG